MVGKEEKTIVLIPTNSSSGHMGPSDWGHPPLHTEELAQRDPFIHLASKTLVRIMSRAVSSAHCKSSKYSCKKSIEEAECELL